MKYLMLALFVLTIAPMASAQYRTPDISCDGGMFEILRSDGLHGDLFNWRFNGHLLQHFLGNRVLTADTRAQVGQETIYRIYLHDGQSSINVGQSMAGETKTAAVVWNGPYPMTLKFTRDSRSPGYFVTALAGPYPGKKVTDYYLHQCSFGKQFRTQ